MADNTAIEWTDATWNPITGCSVVSPGCTNCYAMKLAGGRLQHHPSREGLTTPSKAGPVWNGQVRLNEATLSQPLRWKRPRRIFVCAHGDLFHESVPDAWIDQVFAVMALSPQHTFQVLTKRAERMRDYLTDSPDQARFERRKRITWDVAYKLGGDRAAEQAIRDRGNTPEGMWPLANVWLGVSAEDQARADERIPHLLAIPAAVRFLSAEPLLGPIDLARWLATARVTCRSCSEPFDLHEADPCRHEPDGAWTLACPHCGDCRCIRGKGIRGAPADWLPKKVGRFTHVHPTIQLCPALNWVIVGGESGPGSRPMHADWARQIRDDCTAASVPFFFKQWGEWTPGENVGGANPNFGAFYDDEAGRWHFTVFSPAALDGLHVDDEPDLWSVGKKAAGRLLDGVEHNAMPETDLCRSGRENG